MTALGGATEVCDPRISNGRVVEACPENGKATAADKQEMNAEEAFATFRKNPSFSASSASHRATEASQHIPIQPSIG